MTPDEIDNVGDMDEDGGENNGDMDDDDDD